MLPEVYCPFPVRANPHTQGTEQFLHTVLDKVGAGAVLGTIDIGRLAGLAYPNAGPVRLRIAALWFAFFWLFDEAWADGLPLHTTGELGRVHSRVASVLRGDKTVATDHPSLRMLGVLRETIRSVRPDWDPTAFHREILRYIQSTLWEIDLRARGAVPSLFDYLRMRPLIAAVPPSRELDFLICDLRLDRRLSTHPLVELADAAAGNYSCWINDICSLNTERGSSTNLVIVAQHEFGWSQRQAVEWAAKMATSELITFQELRRTLPAIVLPHMTSAGTEHAELERYLSHYEGWFVASAHWMPTTTKYRTAEVPA